MEENAKSLVFEFGLAEFGGKLTFASPQELSDYNNKEVSEWDRIIRAAAGAMNETEQQHRHCQSQLNNVVQEWREALNAGNSDAIKSRIFPQLQTAFQTYYFNGSILHSTSPKASFIFELMSSRGEEVAAGAYGFLLNRSFNSEIRSPRIFEGMIEGFLVQRDIDWTGAAHSEVFDRLKAEYSENLSNQKKRFKEIGQKNAELNERFDAKLKERDQSLQVLHASQTADFQTLTTQGATDLEAIRKTYDQELALRKPVEYWATKDREHLKLAKTFGWTALAVCVVLTVAMGWLVYWIFVGLKAGEDPKHWQLGILLVAAFFSIWVVRVLLKLSFSNLHLATDAAERGTMIQTYLSMSREGTEFKPEDRKLILEHLFRSASDGLVKDDAAPPSVAEVITRKL